MNTSNRAIVHGTVMCLYTRNHAEGPPATLGTATYLGVREKPNLDDLEFEFPALLVKRGAARD